MRSALVAAIFLLSSAAGICAQTLTIDQNLNVTTPGSVNGNGLNSNGTGAGSLSVTQGAIVQPLAVSFSLVAPATISTAAGYQAIVPQAGLSGLWRGVYGSGAIGTVTRLAGSYTPAASRSLQAGRAIWSLPPVGSRAEGPLPRLLRVPPQYRAVRCPVRRLSRAAPAIARPPLLTLGAKSKWRSPSSKGTPQPTRAGWITRTR